MGFLMHLITFRCQIKRLLSQVWRCHHVDLHFIKITFQSLLQNCNKLLDLVHVKKKYKIREIPSFNDSKGGVKRGLLSTERDLASNGSISNFIAIFAMGVDFLSLIKSRKVKNLFSLFILKKKVA